MSDIPAENAIKDAITTYNDLNSCIIEELDEEPSPLEFMRYVARNTPFVVRGAAADWKASRKWSLEYLRDALGHISVNVAVTPLGLVVFVTSSPSAKCV
jgi:jumonji domain-containing protein 7